MSSVSVFWGSKGGERKTPFLLYSKWSFIDNRKSFYTKDIFKPASEALYAFEDSLIWAACERVVIDAWV